MAYHYFVAVYDDTKKTWFTETWYDATGRDEGDIYDDEADDYDNWRFADNSIAKHEEEINTEAWGTFTSAIGTLPPIKTPDDEEPDVIY